MSWLKTNLLSSYSIFCVRCSDGKYLFEKLNDIVQEYENDVKKKLNNIYDDLQEDKEFKELEKIDDKIMTSRQDDRSVGLLSNLQDGDEKKSKDCQETENIYLGLSQLIVVGQSLNDEFHDFMYDLFKPLEKKHQYVEFKKAPVKTFDRCHAKVEIW